MRVFLTMIFMIIGLITIQKNHDNHPIMVFFVFLFEIPNGSKTQRLIFHKNLTGVYHRLFRTPFRGLW